MFTLGFLGTYIDTARLCAGRIALSVLVLMTCTLPLTRDLVQRSYAIPVFVLRLMVTHILQSLNVA